MSTCDRRLEKLPIVSHRSVHIICESFGSICIVTRPGADWKLRIDREKSGGRKSPRWCTRVTPFSLSAVDASAQSAYMHRATWQLSVSYANQSHTCTDQYLAPTSFNDENLHHNAIDDASWKYMQSGEAEFKKKMHAYRPIMMYGCANCAEKLAERTCS